MRNYSIYACAGSSHPLPDYGLAMMPSQSPFESSSALPSWPSLSFVYRHF